MANINTVPKGARPVAGFMGIINKPDAWTHGKHVSFTKYTDMRSMGYKTDYRAVECVWLVLRVEGQKPIVRQYSGGRLGRAHEVFAGWERDLIPFLVSEMD